MVVCKVLAVNPKSGAEITGFKKKSSKISHRSRQLRHRIDVAGMIGAPGMGQLNLKTEQVDGRMVTRFGLGTAQTMQSAKELHASLVEAADRTQPLIVDASSIERFSTASVQLLLAARKAFTERNIPMMVSLPSDAFLNAFRDLGIEPSGLGWTMNEAGDG